LIYIAVDLGASSGRVLIGNKNATTIEFQEVHRFPNKIVEKNNIFYWDIDYLISEVLNGLQIVKKLGHNKCYLGIDTWAVDYVLLDSEGNRLRDILSYRNMTDKTIDKVNTKISKDIIYNKTGISFMPFNTLFQLYEDDKDLLSKTHSILLIPDYIGFRLTDNAVTERTNASTTQLLNISTKDWDQDLLKILSIKQSQFPKLVEPGFILGKLKNENFPEYDLPNCSLISIASHDTASAVVATPGISENWAFLSSGTWSLLGIEIKKFINTSKAQKNNYTNEYGFDKTTRFLKNIIGLWVLQEIKRCAPIDYTFSELESEAKKEKNFSQFINLNDSRFLNPKNMILEIQNYCMETNQAVPSTIGELANAVFSNLSIIYSIAISELQTITNKNIDLLHIVGGGAYNDYLNKLTADLSGKTVLAGPTEASAIGNFIVQMISTGVIKNLKEGRNIIRNSFEIKEYTPSNIDRDEIIRNFKEVTKYE